MRQSCSRLRSHRRIDMVKASRFFDSRSFTKLKESRFIEQGLDSHQEEFESYEYNTIRKEFLDQPFKLQCSGHPCGSKINKFLIEKTNLKNLQSCKTTQRLMDVCCGRGPKCFYEKLSFGMNSLGNEEKFCTLFANESLFRRDLVSIETLLKRR